MRGRGEAPPRPAAVATVMKGGRVARCGRALPAQLSPARLVPEVHTRYSGRTPGGRGEGGCIRRCRNMVEPANAPPPGGKERTQQADKRHASIREAAPDLQPKAARCVGRRQDVGAFWIRPFYKGSGPRCCLLSAVATSTHAVGEANWSDSYSLQAGHAVQHTFSPARAYGGGSRPCGAPSRQTRLAGDSLLTAHTQRLSGRCRVLEGASSSRIKLASDPHLRLFGRRHDGPYWGGGGDLGICQMGQCDPSGSTSGTDIGHDGGPAGACLACHEPATWLAYAWWCQGRPGWAVYSSREPATWQRQGWNESEAASARSWGHAGANKDGPRNRASDETCDTGPAARAGESWQPTRQGLGCWGRRRRRDGVCLAEASGGIKRAEPPRPLWRQN